MRYKENRARLGGRNVDGSLDRRLKSNKSQVQAPWRAWLPTPTELFPSSNRKPHSWQADMVPDNKSVGLEAARAVRDMFHCVAGSVQWPGPLTRSGEPDMRYKANKEAARRQADVVLQHLTGTFSDHVKTARTRDAVLLQPEDEPTQGSSFIMYHGTSKQNACSIRACGFKPSKDGTLGGGVYVSRDFNKAVAYAKRHGDDGEVLLVLVNVGRVCKIDNNHIHLCKSWRNMGYDTAWVPPKTSRWHCQLEEDCIGDPKNVVVLGTADSQPPAGMIASVENSALQASGTSNSAAAKLSNNLGNSTSSSRTATVAQNSPHSDQMNASKSLQAPACTTPPSNTTATSKPSSASSKTLSLPMSKPATSDSAWSTFSCLSMVLFMLIVIAVFPPSCQHGYEFHYKAMRCKACPAGTYKPWPPTMTYRRGLSLAMFETSLCSSCPPGTYSLAGSSSCTPCKPGTHSSEPGSSRCTQCPAGMISSTPGSIGCTACPAGSMAREPGSSKCTQCPAGTVSSKPGGTDCSLCPAGTISSKPAGTSCAKCPADTYAFGLGNQMCSSCPPGFVSDAGSAGCSLHVACKVTGMALLGGIGLFRR
jgi:hypothetical protein